MDRRKFLYFLLEIGFAFCFLFFYADHSLFALTPSKLYSSDLAYRLQTNALLQGHLSLSPYPFGAPKYDYLWTGHGLQQNWGMGVPFLRLPFEAMAKWFGFGPFPDRLVIVFYTALAVFILNLVFSKVLEELGFAGIAGMILRWFFVSWLMLAPGFIDQIKNGWDVYNEAVFYGCLYGHVLMAFFLIYVLNPSYRIYVILCLISGTAWLVRPTMLSYGLVTVLLASFYAYRNQVKIKPLVAGLIYFSIGIGLGLWFNFVRFGSVLEFGYSGLIGGNPILNYALAFDYPYHYESYFSAARELLGYMFFYGLWPASTFRERFHEGHHFVFDYTHFIILASSLALVLTVGNRIKGRARALPWITVWGALNACLLFGFYMHYEFLSDRYLGDFTPAFFALILGLLLVGLSFYKESGLNQKKFLGVFLLIAIPLFCVYDAAFSFKPAEGWHVLNYDYKHHQRNHDPLFIDRRLVQRRIDSFEEFIAKPNTLAQTLYCPGTNLPPIYEGFSGWDLGSNCYVKVATSIFLPNRSCVTFNYTMPFNQPLPPVQVSKEGRSLRLIDTELYGQGHRKAVKQTFCAGKTAGSPFSYYRIGWVKMDDYGTSKSLPIKLKWISVSSDYMKCLATGINHGNQN